MPVGSTYLTFRNKFWLTVEKLIYILYRIINLIRRGGIIFTLKVIVGRVRLNLRTRKHLAEILDEHRDKTIIIFRPIHDWSGNLHQRPQHIATQLAKKGFLYFYCTPNTFDCVNGFHQVNKRLPMYITNKYHWVEKIPRKKIFHVYAQDPNVTEEYVEKIKTNGDKILYEYIDEIDEKVSISREIVNERHIKVLKDEEIFVVVSAQKLLNEVEKYRTKNYKYVTNGVEYKHFTKKFKRNDVPEGLKPLVYSGKPIIGYYGALASWFDFKLLMRVAQKKPNYQFVLIGPEFDESIRKSRINHAKNIFTYEPVDYAKLPQYAFWFDVCTIPFKVNTITKATSPIKLFEYMALGKPIVTTALPECKKYKSVLIANNADEFVEQLEKALRKRYDKKYKALLKKESLENTWETKGRIITKLIK